MTKLTTKTSELTNESTGSSVVNFNGLDKIFPLVDINLLNPHPEIQKVWEEKNLMILKLTIQLKGLLEPLDVVRRGENYLIVNGISRYYVCKELGWTQLPVHIQDFPDDEIPQRFVYKNFKTKRSTSELVKHAEIILEVLGKSQGKKRERIGNLEMTDEEFSLAGKDRFQIACDLIGTDIGSSTLRKLISVKDFVENGNDEIKGLKLMEKLDTGEMKPHNAFNAMNNYILCKMEEGTNELTESLKYVKGNKFTLFHDTCENLSHIPDNSVDLATHSGPYYHQREFLDQKGEIKEHGLERTPDEFIDKEVEIYSEVFKKLKDTGSLFVNISDSYDKSVDCLIPERLMMKMVENGWYVNQKWYWVKENPKPQRDSKRLMPNVEVMIHFVKDPKKFYFREFKNWKEGKYKVTKGTNASGKGKKKKNHGWTLSKPLERFRNFLNEQHVQNIIEANGFRWDELKEVDPNFRHLAPYPFYIALLPILMCSKVNDTVLDIFSGTGTTAAVSTQLGRHAIGFELDKKTHEFAVKRLTMVEQSLPDINEVIELENEFMISYPNNAA